jgi:hypothetical protein
MGEEDSPVTWEALISPAGGPATRGAGYVTPKAMRLRVHASPGRSVAKKSARPEVGRRQGTTEAETDGDEGVGWPRTSEEVGKPRQRKPAEQRGPVWMGT